MNALPVWLRARPMLVAGLAGAVMAGALAPLQLWWLALPALVLATLLFLDAGSARRAGLIGWAFGAGYFALALAWIVEPFLVDVARDGWMAPFALVLMAGGLALFWGAAFWGAWRLGRDDPKRVLALIALWSLVEFARAYVLTGFPWAALAQIWVGSNAMALLAWVGPHGLALATLGAALPLALAVRSAMQGRFRSWWLAPAVGFAVLAMIASGLAPEVTPSGRVVRLVQPNAQQDKKWDPEFIWDYFRLQLDYTAAGDPGARPDLIVWPETSVPPFLSRAEAELDAVARAANGVPVVLGIRRAKGTRIYNSMLMLDRNGKTAGIYDKRHLVPFGEYVPFGDFAAKFGIRGLAAGQGEGFSAGTGPALLDTGALGQAVPLICYEAVFPQDVAAAPSRGNYLLQITNDAWFGTWSGPYQHLAQSRMRAVEQGLPMIRVANTGISAVIDPVGRIVDSLPLNTAGYLDVALPARAAPTLYARSGDGPVFWLVIVLILALVALQMQHGMRK